MSELQKVARVWADTDPGGNWWGVFVTKNHRELADLVDKAVSYMADPTDPETERKAAIMLTLLVYDHYLESNAGFPGDPQPPQEGGDFPDDLVSPDDWDNSLL